MKPMYKIVFVLQCGENAALKIPEYVKIKYSSDEKFPCKTQDVMYVFPPQTCNQTGIDLD